MSSLSRALQGLRIVYGAVALSTFVVPGVFVVVSESGAIDQRIDGLVAVLFAYGIGQIPVLLIIRNLMRKQAMQAVAKAQDPEDRLKAILVYLKKMHLLFVMIAESFAIFGGVAYLFTQSYLTFLAPGFALGVIVLNWPSQSKWERVVESIELESQS